MAVDAPISDLKRRARMISTLEEITQVATFFANGEHEIGELIATAMERIGKEGIIIVSDESTLDNELEVVEGKRMKLGRGYMSPYFITNKKTQKCELQNPLILIYGKEISTFISIAYMFELVEKESREALVVAADVEGDALNLLFLSKNLGVSEQVIYKYPKRGNVNIEMFSTVKKLRTAMEKSDTMFERERAQERLSNLSDVALKVGGASKAEVGERKDMVEDALNATRAAVEEGIVPCGGVGLLYATKALENLQTQNDNQNQGIQNFQNAIKVLFLGIFFCQLIFRDLIAN
ncbi:hypothetical protein Dsin_018334 [Dipteronia sinensis]|uniref:Uncharacterized protein n=1 Tax=Dipteronia sinensis TaxID=43782 RepID=A0AAE0A6K7_9ROSI|nr:hypothetical protein Dsin_018334 [Dipteronia sinensis]